MGVGVRTRRACSLAAVIALLQWGLRSRGARPAGTGAVRHARVSGDTAAG